MKNHAQSFFVALSLLFWALLARAQAPLAKPLAEFDKLVSQLKIGSVVGEPIRVGDYRGRSFCPRSSSASPAAKP